MSKVIVFSGPPCSGKSTLADVVAFTGSIPSLEMDSIRARILPDASHTRADRQVAYRAMHMLAEVFFGFDQDCIVNASYSHRADRKELEDIAAKYKTAIYLVECRVTPSAAIDRAAERCKTHPGLDLTADRVRELVETFPFSGLGVTIDSEESLTAGIALITPYLTKARPLTRKKWSAKAPD